jgi:hypothetical protein
MFDKTYDYGVKLGAYLQDITKENIKSECIRHVYISD